MRDTRKIERKGVWVSRDEKDRGRWRGRQSLSPVIGNKRSNGNSGKKRERGGESSRGPSWQHMGGPFK